MKDARLAIVGWALRSVHNTTFHSWFNYTEGFQRMADEHRPAPTHGPIYADCSAFVTYCYCWANAPDPNGMGYDGLGYTGTLLLHGRHLRNAGAAIPGDLVVYGPGTGVHTAMIIEAGPDPLTVSNGRPGAPELVRVSQDGRKPQTYLRFNTMSANPVFPPATRRPKPPPGLFLSYRLRGGDHTTTVGPVSSVSTEVR